MTDVFTGVLKNLLRLRKKVSAGEDYADTRLKQNMPLVPADSIAGRALVTVIAIMTFLAAFVTGIGVFVHSASRDWTENISQEMTIPFHSIPCFNY